MNARLLLAGALAAALALPAAALVVDAGDEAFHRRPPRTGLGWEYVGRRDSMSLVYLGDGWVLTARHVGSGDAEIAGETWPAVPDSWQPLANEDGSGTFADLAMFRVQPAPDLPRLPLRKAPLPRGEPLFLIGYGHGRGEAIEVDGIPGYRWKAEAVKRWGTNSVAMPGFYLRLRGLVTRCITMEFGRPGSPHEAQAARGDSGGAVFARHRRRWELAGVLVSVSTMPQQESDTALRGNLTYAAEIPAYRDQILRILAGAPGPAPPPSPRTTAPGG